MTFPTPITLRARLSQALNITGVPIVAQAIAPNGAVEMIPFVDDGTGADETPGDGNYVATYRYAQGGTYTFKVNFNNSTGSGMITYGGATQTATLNGNPPPPIPDQPTADSFTRSSQVQVTTMGGTFNANGGLANISTRLAVQTGDNALIGGFIITGNTSKSVIIRAIGPSLPVAGKLLDPTLQLFNSAGTMIASNDNWRTNPTSAPSWPAPSRPLTIASRPSSLRSLPAVTPPSSAASITPPGSAWSKPTISTLCDFEAGQHLHPRPRPDGRQRPDWRHHRHRKHRPKHPRPRHRPLSPRRRRPGRSDPGAFQRQRRLPLVERQLALDAGSGHHRHHHPAHKQPRISHRPQPRAGELHRHPPRRPKCHRRGAGGGVRVAVTGCSARWR